ncbi:tryptophan synthase subunit alpha [Bacteroidota bacterium]
MENRINILFREKSSDILNIYFTAGYPELESTGEIIMALDKAGVDMVEIGMPYSDPLADGPTIQESSSIALQNGMKLSILFSQIKEVRKQTKMPFILMGYYNQLLQFGFEKFCYECKSAGVDGLIIPDLPLVNYEKEYIHILKKYNLRISFLITPKTHKDRIILIDKLSTSFVYVVSSSSVTGNKLEMEKYNMKYFEEIKNMNLNNPILIGFGINNKKSFNFACNYANGAIIGSAFIKALSKSKNIHKTANQFINSIKE